MLGGRGLCGQSRRVGCNIGREPTQFLIDPATTKGKSSGLTHPSAVKCENLMTVPKTDVRKTLGHLSDTLKKELEQCLKEALQLP